MSVRQLACEAKDFMNSPGNGGCEGGWVDKNLDYMRSNGVCKKRDVDWPWYCIGNDCLECDGNWYGASKAMYPSCNRNKLTTGGDWRSLQLPTNDAGITALKNYLQNEGTFGYNFEVNNDFMFMGSNLGGWFGGDCDGELPYKGGADSCCRKKKKKSCSWWGSCSDRRWVLVKERGSEAKGERIEPKKVVLLLPSSVLPPHSSHFALVLTLIAHSSPPQL